MSFKKDKKELKNWEICAHLEFKTHYRTHKNTVVSTSEVHILINLLLKTFRKKPKSNKLINKKIGQLDKKRLKIVIYMRHSVKKKHFSKLKSHSLIAAHDQKTSS